jgi:hypothetical protein
MIETQIILIRQSGKKSFSFLVHVCDETCFDQILLSVAGILFGKVITSDYDTPRQITQHDRI